MPGRGPFPWLASSWALMAANATHQPKGRCASTPVAAASRSVRASTVPRSSACHRNQTASKAASPRPGAGSIATRPLGSTVEGVAGSQVTVEHEDRGAGPRAGARAHKLRRYQRREPRMTFVEFAEESNSRPRAARPSDRTSREAAPVQGAQELGGALRGRVDRGDDERCSRFERLDQKRPSCSSSAITVWV
jgi:hypothetical protein